MKTLLVLTLSICSISCSIFFMTSCSTPTKPLPTSSVQASPSLQEMSSEEETKTGLNAEESKSAILWEGGQLNIQASFNGEEWELIASGDLPNGCYRFSNIEVRKIKKEVFELKPMILFNSERKICPMMMVPFSAILDLSEKVKSKAKYEFRIDRGNSNVQQIRIQVPASMK